MDLLLLQEANLFCMFLKRQDLLYQVILMYPRYILMCLIGEFQHRLDKEGGNILLLIDQKSRSNTPCSKILIYYKVLEKAPLLQDKIYNCNRIVKGGSNPLGYQNRKKMRHICNQAYRELHRYHSLDPMDTEWIHISKSMSDPLHSLPRLTIQKSGMIKNVFQNECVLSISTLKISILSQFNYYLYLF